MADAQVVWLNGGERDEKTNAPLAQAFSPIGEDPTAEENRIPYGKVPLIPCLGIAAMPAPPDADGGHCEAVVLPGVGGMPGGVCVGARDTRSFDMCAGMKPGDTVLHSTGPNKAAQVQLKEGKRQAVIVAKKADGEQMMFVLDGDMAQIKISANGAFFQITADGAINMSTGPAGIDIVEDTIHLRCGKLLIGGMNPAFALAQVPPTVGLPIPPTGGLVPAAPGIFVCT